MSHPKDTYLLMKQTLRKGLFEVSPKEKFVTPKMLSLLYTPGVGSVCMEIVHRPELIDVLTNRANSVAIVSTGAVLCTSGKNVHPLMDWLIAQIKYYSYLDAYPFAVDPGIDWEVSLADLSNSYGAVLLLEEQVPIHNLPKDLIVLSQPMVAKHYGVDISDAQYTAKILDYLLKSKSYGEAKLSAFYGIDPEHETTFIQPSCFYSKKIGNNIEIGPNSIDIHKFRQGKLQIDLNFFDITRLKRLFTLQNLKKLTREHSVSSNSSQLYAIVTDGTAILGLGNIGPRPGLPVMQGKSTLFKHLGNIQVVPLCINRKSTVEATVKSIYDLVCNFAGINLEDISAPNCFEVQDKLLCYNFPVFHDDQHGTAIVILAALINSARVIGTPIRTFKVVLNGAGAAGLTTANLLLYYGIKDLIVCDTEGAIYKGRESNMNGQKEELSKKSNRQKKQGKLADVICGADVFIGVSAAGVFKGEWIKKMSSKPIIFALANPIPQILPDVAIQSGAFIVATGRSDFGNQINNSLAFPGIFRSFKQHNIKSINMDMKVAAAEAISLAIKGSPSPTNIVPLNMDRDVALLISEAVGQAKHKSLGRL